MSARTVRHARHGTIQELGLVRYPLTAQLSAVGRFCGMMWPWAGHRRWDHRIISILKGWRTAVGRSVMTSGKRSNLSERAAVEEFRWSISSSIAVSLNERSVSIFAHSWPLPRWSTGAGSAWQRPAKSCSRAQTALPSPRWPCVLASAILEDFQSSTTAPLAKSPLRRCGEAVLLNADGSIVFTMTIQVTSIALALVGRERDLLSLSCHVRSLRLFRSFGSSANVWPRGSPTRFVAHALFLSWFRNPHKVSIRSIGSGSQET